MRAPSFCVVLSSSATIAAAASDTSVTPRKPYRKGVIRQIVPVVIDPAYSAQSTGANAYALLDRVGARIFVNGKPLAGTESNDFVPLSALLGSREAPAEWEIPVDQSDELSAEFKNLDTAGSPGLFVRLVFKLSER